LVINLLNGQLHDASGRTGYIAANYQFQFDNPPQTGAIYTGGFSSCSNGSLALGGSAVFYECLSGSFYNLYDRQWAPQCEPILIDILPCGSSGDPVGQQSDGQPTGTGIATITQISDGQPQAPTATVEPITQLSDGQPQAPTATVKPITQLSDGQPQAPTATVKPITQLSDGQPQAPAPTSTVNSSFPSSQTATSTAVGSFATTGSSAPATGATSPASATTSPAQATSGAGNTLVGGSSFAALIAGLIAAVFL
jgi:hypothetical protein